MSAISSHAGLKRPDPPGNGERGDGMKERIKSLKPKITAIDTRIGSAPGTERIRGHRLYKIRQRIALRDEYTCCVCGRVTINGVVDHITPLHLGGAESDENRQWLCRPCHDLKSEQEEKERGK